MKLPPGTTFTLKPGAQVESRTDAQRDYATIPPGTQIQYPDSSPITRSEAFKIARLKSAEGSTPTSANSFDVTDGKLTLPAGVSQAVPGSSWGTFTIACTIPIALFVGLYMYKLRRGKILEASLIGATATIAVTIAGNWIPGSVWEKFFSLSREETIIALCSYGFIASVLPVWLLLCPRDYLSSFLKIGTVALLVTAVIVANPKLQAPSVNQEFAGGGGPNMNGAIFPFLLYLHHVWAPFQVFMRWFRPAPRPKWCPKNRMSA